MKLVLSLTAVVLMTTSLLSWGAFYADEAVDFGVDPTSELTRNYHRKTPTTVPGAKTVTTEELKKILAATPSPLLFDVLGGNPSERKVIPNAILLGFDGGDGNVFASEKARFSAMLEKVTGGDKNKPLIFYCLNNYCWLSYNAVNRAIGEGYTNVMWYRGGWNAWKEADGMFQKPAPFTW